MDYFTTHPGSTGKIERQDRATKRRYFACEKSALAETQSILGDDNE